MKPISIELLNQYNNLRGEDANHWPSPRPLYIYPTTFPDIQMGDQRKELKWQPNTSFSQVV